MQIYCCFTLIRRVEYSLWFGYAIALESVAQVNLSSAAQSLKGLLDTWQCGHVEDVYVYVMQVIVLCCSPGLSLSVSSVWVTGQFNHSVSVNFSLCVSFLSLQSHLLFKGYCMKRWGLLRMYHRQNTRHSMVCPNQIGSGFQRVYHVIIFRKTHRTQQPLLSSLL